MPVLVSITATANPFLVVNSGAPGKPGKIIRGLKRWDEGRWVEESLQYYMLHYVGAYFLNRTFLYSTVSTS